MTSWLDGDKTIDSSTDPGSVFQRSSRISCSTMIPLKFVNFVVYFIFFAFFMNSMISGPLNNLLANRTEIITDQVVRAELGENIQTRLLPTVTLCRFPSFKDANPFFLANESQAGNLTSYLKSMQYIHPHDFIFLMEVGVNMTFNIKIDPRRFLIPFITDNIYFGYCLLGDLEEIFQDVFGDDYHKATLPGFNIAFQDRDKDKQTPDRIPSYFVYVHDRDEELFLSGPCALGANPFFNKYIQVHPGEGAMYDLEPIVIEDLRHCDQGNVKLSECILRHVNDKVNDCTSEDVERGRCRLDEFFKRWNYFTSLKTEGFEYLEEASNCQLPCQRIVCKLNEIVTGDVWKVFPAPALAHIPRDSAVIRLRFPKFTKINRIKEIEAYTVHNFVSDMGGIMGLFLGLSFWGIYKQCRDGLLFGHGNLKAMKSMVKIIR